MVNDSPVILNKPKKLFLINIHNQNQIDPFEEDVETIDIIRCGITSLPEIPTSAKKVLLSDCHNLTSIESFGKGVETIDIIRCGITSLPEIPTSAKKVLLADCNLLAQTPELFRNLLALENAGCDITFPLHWNLSPESENAKLRLDKIIERYKKDHPDYPTPNSIKTLLHRFVTEGVGFRERGSILDIIKSVTPVLDIFEKDPNQLEWAEEVAKNYLAGCVNQPVAGWSEISALAAMAQKQTVKEKIESATQLIALHTITQHIATLPKEDKPGSQVEVEAGNILLREVHKRLLSEEKIAEPWLAVPQKIRYELLSYVGFLREEVIDNHIKAAYDEVEKTLTKTIEEKANFLCESHYRESWGFIAFPREIAKIKSEYADKIAEENDGEVMKKIGEEMIMEIAVKIKKLTEESINPKLKPAEQKSGENAIQQKPTYAERLRNEMKTPNVSNKTMPKKLAFTDKLRQEVREVRNNVSTLDFSKADLKDPRVDGNILTRNNEPHYTPAGGELRPVNTRKGNVAKSHSRLNKTQPTQPDRGFVR